MITDISSKGRGDLILAILTFNYDIALDLALTLERIPIDYSLGNEIEKSLPVLKLHGSINWTTEIGPTRKIVPWTLPDYLAKVNWHALTKGDIAMPMGSQFTHFSKEVDGSDFGCSIRI